MAKDTLPRLTEAAIRKLASGPSFERGEGYYQGEAILEPVRQGMELRAECEGSQYEPYDVSATLTAHGVGATSCTCPYEGGGLCKHIVALLLTYVQQPQAFRVIPPLDAMLAQRSQADLIALIGAMLTRHPDLMAVVELSTDTSQGQAADLAGYRRQVRRAFRSDSLRDIDRELGALGETAARLEKAGDWLNAGALYHLLLDETVGQYRDDLQEMDDEGDLAMQVNEFAEGLGRCLGAGQPTGETRRAWLEVLLEAELTDIELGGIELAPSAWDALLEHATDVDWDWIEPRVRTEIQKSRDWAREALVNLLRERKERQGQEEDTGALVRELGTPEQRAVAQAAEKNHPREALSLYKDMVEDAIRGRDRRAYRQAAQHLKRLQAVYKALKAQGEWEAYLHSLRTQYRHLPALQDELRQAHL